MIKKKRKRDINNNNNNNISMLKKAVVVASALLTSDKSSSSSSKSNKRFRRRVCCRVREAGTDCDTTTTTTSDGVSNALTAELEALEVEEEEEKENDLEDEYVEEEVEVEYTAYDHAIDFMNEVKTKRQDVCQSCFRENDDDFAVSRRRRRDVDEGETRRSSSVANFRERSCYGVYGENYVKSEIVSVAIAIAFAFVAKRVRTEKERRENWGTNETWTVNRMFEELKMIDCEGDRNEKQKQTMRAYDEEDLRRDLEKKEIVLNERRSKELERRKIRDENERLREQEEQRERERLVEIERRKEEEEERKRELVRAEFRLKQLEEQERLKKREEEEQMRKKRELDEDVRKREEKMRIERERVEAERERRMKIAEERLEKTFEVEAKIKVEARRKNGKCEVTAQCSIEFSNQCEVSETHENTEYARLQMSWASKLSADAMKAYKSDVILKKMMGEGILARNPTFNALEFEHWMKIIRVRLDREIRTTGLRAIAGLEANKLTKNDSFIEREVIFKRALLPTSDPQCVENRIQNAIRLLVDQVEEKKKETESMKDDLETTMFGYDNNSISNSGIGGSPDEELDPGKSPMAIMSRICEHELAQMHGLDPSLVFPAETDGLTTQLNGRVLSGILTASHFVKVLRLVTKDSKPEVLKRGIQIAAALVGRCANDEGNWRAMYLDGFRGDALEAGALMAKEVIPEEENDIVLSNIFSALEAMEKVKNRRPEEQGEKIDQEVLRKMKARRRMNSVPITERLFATRNAAIQLAGSGSVEQGRAMLEEAYALRINHVEKRRKELGLKSNEERFGIPETLPELKALLFVLEYGGSAWEVDKRGVQKQILKAVYESCVNGTMKKDSERALATFSAIRKYFFTTTAIDAKDSDLYLTNEWENNLLKEQQQQQQQQRMDDDTNVEDFVKKYYPNSLSDALDFAVSLNDAEIEARRKI